MSEMGREVDDVKILHFGKREKKTPSQARGKPIILVREYHQHNLGFAEVLSGHPLNGKSFWKRIHLFSSFRNKTISHG